MSHLSQGHSLQSSLSRPSWGKMKSRKRPGVCVSEKILGSSFLLKSTTVLDFSILSEKAFLRFRNFAARPLPDWGIQNGGNKWRSRVYLNSKRVRVFNPLANLFPTSQDVVCRCKVVRPNAHAQPVD